VDAPLTGRTGAAETFGPQKGAAPSEVRLLDAGLSRLVKVLGSDPHAPGCGAAGGTAYGLAAAWGAAMVPGSRELADLAGLATQLVGADVVITGEGSLDHQSLGGKVVSQVQSEARRAEVPVWVVAGVVDPATAREFGRVVELASLAGGADRSLAEPQRWLVEAGRLLAAACAGPARSRRG
jgi:glycerate kinase